MVCLLPASAAQQSDHELELLSPPARPRAPSPQPWGDTEKAEWLAKADVKKRSYKDAVIDEILSYKGKFDVEQYGALSQDEKRYPLFCITTKGFEDRTKPYIMVTGGTHGYEESGVHGALLFVKDYMETYSKWFNIAVVPCVCPWGYECIQRWDNKTNDPNRSYTWAKNEYLGEIDTPVEECRKLMELLKKMAVPQWLMQLDLHETTDTDAVEFMPALFSRDGVPFEFEEVPDGFYLIGDVEEPRTEWHAAMIEAVSQVTHIAEPIPTLFPEGNLIGLRVTQKGACTSKAAGKGKGVTHALYCSTTEVYPDSKNSKTKNGARRVTKEQSNLAQATCIVSGIDWLLEKVVLADQAAVLEKTLERLSGDLDELSAAAA